MDFIKPLTSAPQPEVCEPNEILWEPLEGLWAYSKKLGKKFQNFLRDNKEKLIYNIDPCCCFL